MFVTPPIGMKSDSLSVRSGHLLQDFSRSERQNRAGFSTGVEKNKIKNRAVRLVGKVTFPSLVIVVKVRLSCKGLAEILVKQTQVIVSTRVVLSEFYWLSLECEILQLL